MIPDMYTQSAQEDGETPHCWQPSVKSMTKFESAASSGWRTSRTTRADG